jgi:hypothetical protein
VYRKLIALFVEGWHSYSVFFIKKTGMHNRYFLVIGLYMMAVITACMVQKNEPSPFPQTIHGKWVLTDTQSAGIGPPGIWAKAVPDGRWMEIDGNNAIAGSVFPAATGYQVVDSVTLKVMDPSQEAGFRMFSFHLDTTQKALLLYKRPPNGRICFEGCGTYKFIPANR